MVLTTLASTHLPERLRKLFVVGFEPSGPIGLIVKTGYKLVSTLNICCPA